MKELCKFCKKFFDCKVTKQSLPVSLSGCANFDYVKKHDCVVIHLSCLSRKFFIIGFADTPVEGDNIKISHPCYGSKNHKFFVCDNTVSSSALDVINDIKDNNLLCICENVAFALSRGEYHMLKHRYSKSKSCFDLAKKHISEACYLLDNY